MAHQKENTFHFQLPCKGVELLTKHPDKGWIDIDTQRTQREFTSNGKEKNPTAHTETHTKKNKKKQSFSSCGTNG